MDDPKHLEEGRSNGARQESGDNGHLQLERVSEDIHGDNKYGEEEERKAEEQPLMKEKKKRIATLDAFRGLTIVLMILVDDAGEAYSKIDHSPWNGCTLADFVLPFFLFIVGVAIALALKVQCGMRGHLGPACNAVGYVDRQIWGINHLYTQPVWSRLRACTFSSPDSGPFREDAPTWCRAPFEPEGLLSSISAIVTGTIGIHYGHVLIHFKDHAQRLKHWVSMGVLLLIIASVLHFTDAIPINKQLYSFSYVCFTAGAAGIVFSVLYIVIDVYGMRTPFLFLEWIGMNAMLVFVLAAQGIFAAFVNGWYFENPDKNLVKWIRQHVFVDVWNSERVGTLLYVIFAEITFWSVVSGILHKLGIYWKL